MPSILIACAKEPLVISGFCRRPAQFKFQVLFVSEIDSFLHRTTQIHMINRLCVSTDAINLLQCISERSGIK